MAKENKVTQEEFEEYMNDPQKKEAIEKVLKDEKRKRKAEEVLINKQKTQDLITKASDTMRKMDDVPVIGAVFDNAATLIDMVGDYASHKYTAIPKATIISVVIGLIYLISPIDLIPDVIPVIGMVDDAAVLAFVLKAISKDLDDYKAWKKQQAIPATEYKEIEQ